MILVVHTRCARCHEALTVEEPNATGDLFIDLVAPEYPQFTALCKNAQLCAEREKARG